MKPLYLLAVLLLSSLPAYGYNMEEDRLIDISNRDLVRIEYLLDIQFHNVFEDGLEPDECLPEHVQHYIRIKPSGMGIVVSSATYYRCKGSKTDHKGEVCDIRRYNLKWELSYCD